MSFHIFKFKDPENCPIFEAIKNGDKTVEGRKNSQTYSIVKVDDYIYLDNGKEILMCKVIYINKYKDVKSYLESEGIKKALPCAKTIDEGLKIYETFVPKEQIEKLNQKHGFGFLGIGIKFLGIKKKHVIPVSNPWFKHIFNGNKTAEGRLKKGKFLKLEENDLVYFVHGNDTSLVRIKKIIDYESIKKMLEGEGLKNVLPNINNIDEGVNIYRQWYSEEDEKKYGVIAIRIKLSDNYFRKKYFKYKNKYKTNKK